MACPYHEGQKKILVCLPCKTCVCEVCIDENHVEHKICSLKAAAKIVINDLVEACHQPYATLKEHHDKISTLRQTEEKRADNSRQELRDKREKIKQLVDEVTNASITKLDDHNAKLFVDLEEAKTNATEQLQKVQQFQDEVAQLQASTEFVDVVEKGWCMKVPEVLQLDFPKVSQLTIKQDMPANRDVVEAMFGELIEQNMYAATFHTEGTYYTPVLGKTYNQNLSPTSSICTLDLFGDGPDRDPFTETHTDVPADVHVQCASTSQTFKCELNLTLKHSFKTDKSAAVMRPTMEGTCWLRYHNDHSIRLVNTNGDTLQVVQYGAFVSDILVLPGTTRISVTCPGEKLLKVWIKPGHDTTVTRKEIHTNQMKPYYTCGAPNGEILVLMTNKSSCCEEPNTETVLVRYDNKGNELVRADKDGHGGDLFFFPSKVCSSNTGMITVINRTNMLSSHLMLLDDQLGLIYRYIDHGVTVTAEEQTPSLKEQFSVTDALFNHNNLLIISEYYSRTVQLLDLKCNQLKLLATEDQSPPLSLALHANGDLWVGFHDKTVKVFVYSCTLEPE